MSLSERIVHNNRTFREANEKIRSRADDLRTRLERFPFLCECPQPDCTDIIFLTRAEYSSVREDDTQYFTKPGHEEAEAPVGAVVRREVDYVVVEKQDEAD